MYPLNQLIQKAKSNPDLLHFWCAPFGYLTLTKDMPEDKVRELKNIYENVWRRISDRYNVDVLLSTVQGKLGVAFEWFWSFGFAKERGIRNAQEAELALSVTAYSMVRDFPYAEVYYGISPCSDEYEILLFVPIEHIADFEATASEDLEGKYRLEKCDILH